VELPDNVPDPEDAVVRYTNGGYLKRGIPAQLKRTPVPSPEESLEDSARFLFQTTTAETLYIFTDLGNCYPVQVGQRAESKPRDRGQLLSGVLMGLEDGEQALYMLTADAASLKQMPDFLFITKNGMIKRTAAADYDVRSRKYPALSLKKGDSLLTVLPAQTDGDLLLITRGGMSIRFPLNTVPVQGRIATGVKAMGVEAGDEVSWVLQLRETDEIVLFSERGWAKRIPQVDFEPQNRAGKGVRCFYFNKNGSNGKAVAGVCPISRDTPCDLLIRQVRSPMSKLSRDDILLQNRAGKGMPYVMAILDDIVTGITAIDAPSPAEAESPENT
jgi:DNA gyrase/topoisomerase IV subunit A